MLERSYLLTHFIGREAWQDCLSAAIARGDREETSVAVMMMHLEPFGELNDAFGYLQGDLLLQEAATRLRGALRNADMIAYFGDNEFAMILPGTDIKGVAPLVEKIRQRFALPVVISEIPIRVTVCMGIAIAPCHGKKSDDLTKRAKAALHTAKKTKTAYNLYDMETEQRASKQWALLQAFQQALQTEQLKLHAQPKINPKTFRLIGAEMLVRWPTPQNLLLPCEFIPLVEQTDLSKSLDLWVLKTAIHQYAVWKQMGFDIPIVVNLCKDNLHDVEIRERIGEWLAEEGVPPEKLTVEIQERDLLNHPSQAEESIASLHKMRVRISVQNIFWNSFFAQPILKKLQVEEMKICNVFIPAMMTDEVDYVLVYAVVELCQNLGIEVVAGGVETESVFTNLLAFGCERVQGNYISPPLPLEQLTEWLSQSPYTA